MNTNELILVLAAKLGLPKDDVEKSLTVFRDSVIQKVAEGHAITFRSLGTIEKIESSDPRQDSTGKIYIEEVASGEFLKKDFRKGQSLPFFIPSKSALDGKEDVEILPSDFLSKGDETIATAALKLVKKCISRGEKVTIEDFGTFCREKNYDNDEYFAKFNFGKVFHTTVRDA